MCVLFYYEVKKPSRLLSDAVLSVKQCSVLTHCHSHNLLKKLMFSFFLVFFTAKLLLDWMSVLSSVAFLLATLKYLAVSVSLLSQLLAEFLHKKSFLLGYELSIFGGITLCAAVNCWFALDVCGHKLPSMLNRGDQQVKVCLRLPIRSRPTSKHCLPVVLLYHLTRRSRTTPGFSTWHQLVLTHATWRALTNVSSLNK